MQKKPENGSLFSSNYIFTAVCPLKSFVEFDQSFACWISNMFYLIDFISSIFNKLKCYKNILHFFFHNICHPAFPAF